MKKWTLFLTALVVLTMARLAAVAFEQPSPQETYYFLCAAQPAAAYFDGPAGTAFVVGFLDQLGGWDFLWRFPAPLWAFVATLVCFALVKRMSTEGDAYLAALVLNVLPAFNAASIRVTPWLPAVTFSLVGLFFAWKALHSEKRPLPFWVASGLGFSVGVFFAYESVVIVPFLAILVFSSHRHRRVGDILGVFLAAALPLVAMVPALRWNAGQDWLPMAGGTFRTIWQFDFSQFGEALQEGMLALSPLLLIGAVWAWVALIPAVRTRVRSRLVFVVASPGILLGLYFLLRGRVELFWWVLALPLVVWKIASEISGSKLGRAAVGLAFALAVCFSGYSALQAYDAGGEWPSRAQEVRAMFLEKLAEGEDSLFLIGENPEIASELGYYLRDDLIPPTGHPRVYVRESQNIANQFSLWKGYDDFVDTSHVVDEFFTEQKGENPFVGRSALYVSSEPLDELAQSIKGAFASVTLLKTLSPTGRFQEPLYIYLCLNYQTLPL